MITDEEEPSLTLTRSVYLTQVLKKRTMTSQRTRGSSQRRSLMTLPSNISIEYQRDTALRVYELLLVNRERSGREHAVLLYCFDDGRIAILSDKENENYRFIRVDHVLSR